MRHQQVDDGQGPARGVSTGGRAAPIRHGLRLTAFAGVAALIASVGLVLSTLPQAARPDGGRGGATPPIPGSSTPQQQQPPHGQVTVCGIQLCVAGATWFMRGASVYNPGLRPERSGYLNPSGAVAIARQAGLNTIRVVNFYPDDGSPISTPYGEATWQQVDQMVAAAGASGLHVDLDLADYRNILWNSCIEPYTSDWTSFIAFVADRRNTVTGRVYSHDPTIAMVGISGEPLPVGTHTFTARRTGRPCTLSYTAAELTAFYARTTGLWKQLGASVAVSTGGFGYLDLPTSGIDWRAIVALPTVDFCDIKTYGGMLAFARTVAQHCRSIGKPWIDEEFGWRQSDGDAQRAADLAGTCATVLALGSSGYEFWNLGYEVAGTSYDIGPGTPAAFAAVKSCRGPG